MTGIKVLWGGRRREAAGSFSSASSISPRFIWKEIEVHQGYVVGFRQQLTARGAEGKTPRSKQGVLRAHQEKRSIPQTAVCF